jgi:hypothetical protein
VAKEAEATLVTNEVTKQPADDTDTADHMHLQFEEQDTHWNFLQHTDYRSVVMNQGSSTVPKAWILLDNQSTVDGFDW